MIKLKRLDKIAISIKSRKIVKQFVEENPEVASILMKAETKEEANDGIKEYIMDFFEKHQSAYRYQQRIESGRAAFENLGWNEIAAIRILDYVENAGRKYKDLNINGKIAGSNPFKFLWLGIKLGRGGAKSAFFQDMLHLFRQLNSKPTLDLPTKSTIQKWMDRHPSGIEPAIIDQRKKNKLRILKIIIKKLENGEFKSKRYVFEPFSTKEEKVNQVLKWWDDYKFHLKFAIRNPKLLNEMLDGSLSTETMKILERAKESGIPLFINPYYLSLLNVIDPEGYEGSDLAIRDYVIYSKKLIEQFGNIVAWEKEDVVEPGRPNAAGWLLPSLHNIHRRYPEVAILIPDTEGRACGGLCVSCQRMYDFQSGHLNFNLDKLRPKETWPAKLERLMEYYLEDSQLRDVLITGGDALMNGNKSLKLILDTVYETALKKIENNKNKKEGEKYAEIQRIRLGTRLPVYLPQRITPELINILADFKDKASAVGVQQFVIQTHFETPMEITPEVAKAIKALLSAGWIVVNQQVFIAAGSRRGHTAKLRKELNDIGVITYYTFSVKGYKENSHNFSTNARAVQEQIEEKAIGMLTEHDLDLVKSFTKDPVNLQDNLLNYREEKKMPFVAMDRNVMNLPGVGKSSTFRTVGITRDARRILEFDFDHTRNHSPIVETQDKVVVIESKSISDYLEQLEGYGEDINEYLSIFGYSIGETEKRNPVYEYPKYDYKITDEITHFQAETIADPFEEE